jgi:hypothetical protein
MPALLLIEKHSEEWPDFFGYAHRVAANECAITLNDGDEDLFATLFRPFFSSCLAAHDRLVQEVGTAPNPWSTIYISEPIVDLLYLSGLAKIYSELDSSQFWDVVQQTWDSYIESAQAETVAFLTLMIHYRKSVFMATPYHSSRTQWKQCLEDRLSNLGLLSDDFWDPGARHVARKALHESPVIRALVGRNWRIRCDPEDVFVVTYLRRRPGGDELELTSDQALFEEELRREEAAPSPPDEED